MMSTRWQQALLACGIGMTGAVATLPAPILEFEEEVGLDWLFLLRGPVEAPRDIVVVSIDSESASEFGLSLEPDEWPRSLYAEGIDQLRTAGAGVIAVDLSFRDAREAGDDETLAESIRASGNVVLLELMDVISDSPAVRAGLLQGERRFPPMELFANAALGTAPFPLPKDPLKVSRYWAFGRNDTGLLTLPSAVVHAYALDGHDELLDLIEAVRPGVAASLPRRAELSPDLNLTSAGRQIRGLFLNDPQLAVDLRSYADSLRTNQQSRELRDRRGPPVELLIALYGGPYERHLDFYGPARTIQTIPYERMLKMSPAEARDAFGDKIVFIGYSEPGYSRQDDDFQTPFTDDGTNLNGVEIGATAVGNMLDGRFVLPIPRLLLFAILLLWGTAIVGALLWLPVRLGAVSTVTAGAAWLLLATTLFQLNGIWLPVIMPVFAQIPLALIGVLGWKYTQAGLQRDRVRRTLETYLPKHALDELSRRVEGVLPDSRLLHGTCLITDAQNYTTLAERLAPKELQKALNAYYAVLFPEVERHAGFVADVIGDSMVAIWATPEADAAARLNACRAAIAIEQSTRAFNAANPDFPLPTRIGIHAGEILLGNVGTQSHLEYRPIGDIVNTASRIQDFNKQLRTTLLVSENVLENADAVSYRRLGQFLLAGKGVPVRLCDRITFSTRSEPEISALIEAFDEALLLFLARRWDDSAAAFEKLLEGYPADGPSEFYMKLCRRYAAEDPGPRWAGAVSVAMT